MVDESYHEFSNKVLKPKLIMMGDVTHGKDIEGKVQIFCNFLFITISFIFITSKGFSLYGRNFEDESFEVKFDRKGILGMINEGKPDTNASKFFITLDAVSLFLEKK